MFGDTFVRTRTTSLLLVVLFAARLSIEKHLSLLTAPAENRPTCLATNTYQKRNHKHIGNPRNLYPVDLFGEDPSDCHSCFFQPVKLHEEKHSCSKSRFVCPVKEKYIPIIMGGFENASTQVCHSLRALEERSSEQNVNVFIVGGSVTHGGYADGCLEGSCSELNSDLVCVKTLGNECAWHYGVKKYLQHRYENPKLNVIDFSWGGSSSCTFPHLFVQQLEANNVTLTSRDLVLYDYSVNDGVSFSSHVSLNKLRHCMEAGIERLTKYSQDGIPPAVILLEYYSYRGLDVSEEFPEPDSYTKVYREVATKFHLPVISYRDLFWHSTFREDLKQFPKLKYIFENKWAEPSNADIHPPWVVHDFYADVLAGALHLTHQICKNRSPDSVIEIAAGEWLSSPASEDLVLLHEEATTANAPHLTPEEVHRLPHGWNLYQDRLGKPGWIVEGLVDKTIPESFLSFSAPYNASAVSSTSPAALEVSPLLCKLIEMQGASL
jgi:hypothetical protein